MHCLVIGYGSIGKRHAQILKNLDCDVSLVTAQAVEHFACYTTLKEALAKNHIDYVVIANATHLHLATLADLARNDFHGKVLVEKPLFSAQENVTIHQFDRVFVGYNLRFCEPLRIAKNMLMHDSLISFSACVGQYLPTWRKESDYRKSYSAKQAEGGGVLHDLSHELDYSHWFCGESVELTAIGGHYSKLQIDSDDIYSILMRCERCPIVNIQLNYLDRVKRRDVLIHTEEHSLYIDLIKGTLTVDGELVFHAESAITESYIKQHQAVLTQQYDQLCSYEDGLYVVNLIEKATAANFSRQWIKA